MLTFLPCREAIESKERSTSEIGGDEGKATGATREPGTEDLYTGGMYIAGNYTSLILGCHWVLEYPKTWQNLIPIQTKSSHTELHGAVQLCWLKTWVLRRGSGAGNARSEQFSPIFRGTPILVLVEISLCLDTYK